MLRLLIGRDWIVNRNIILSRIAEDVAHKRGGRILIVPELISHDTERRLCAAAGDTASRYAEVLTFTRMARRVCESMDCLPGECLDNGGRIVAMASAARQLSSRLKAYSTVETKPEFLADLITGVDEFKRCCISSADLMEASKETEGSLAQKLEELSLLMEAYDGLCSSGKRDPRDQMSWLLEQMEEGTFGQDHVFYIDGFPDLSRQHMAIIEHLIRVCPEVTISLNCDSVASGLLAFEKAGQTASQLIRSASKAGIPYHVEALDERHDALRCVRRNVFQGPISSGIASDVLRVFRTENIWQECQGAAEQILSLIHDGCRYRDITIACGDMPSYKSTLEMIFHRMNIPYYLSGTEDILQKSVISTVLSALDAALGGYDQRQMFRYLRSGLSPLSMDECDIVENYAVVWGIRGSRWMSEWDYHPDGLGGQWDDASREKLISLNAFRDIAVGPLERLRRRFREASKMSEQIEALDAFLTEIGLEEKLYLLAQRLDEAGDNREAQILEQLWDILIGAMEQMYDVLGETYWDGEHFTRLFRLLLSQYNVGTIPPVLDAVQIGQISAMRCHEQKHLIILGAREGSFPGYPGSAGVLTDQERYQLRELGIPLLGMALEGIQTEFSEIYGIICGAQESVSVFYSGEQPSFVCRRLSQLAGGEQVFDKGFDYAAASPWEAGAWLARSNSKEEAQALGVIEGYLDVCRLRDHSIGRVHRDRIRMLYGNTLNLSASQIDRQAECRMSYFLKYGLRVQERKEAAVDPAEFGTYVHAVLENTARCVQDMGGFDKVSLEETLNLAHRFSDEYAKERFGQLASDRVTYLFQRNIRELDMVVKELWDELRCSSFVPKDFEVNFGSADGLPAIVIPNNSMNAILRGFVDRVDTWNKDGNCYYRVVDYKTGKKDFDYCDVFNGVGLQMLLYLFALRNSGAEMLGNRPVPAGVQYFPARAPYLPTDGVLTDEEAEKNRQSQWKRRGILLKDEDVLLAMDPNGQSKRLSCTIKKDGTISGDSADREQLDDLETYVFRVVGKMVDEIASGNVTPNPYSRGASHDACAFCPYGSICHKGAAQDRRNYKAMPAKKFWEEIDKEMNRHGR